MHRACQALRIGKIPAKLGKTFPALAQRLLLPLDEAFAVVRANTIHRNGAAIILLREMHRQQLSFWAWTPQNWIDLLCSSAEQFAQLHNGVTAYRPYLVAVSYLLSGFTDFLALGKFGQKWLAVRVFGADRLDGLVDLLGEELVRLGFGEKSMHVRLHTLLYEIFLMNRSPLLADLSFEVLKRMRPKLTTAHLRSYMVSLSRALASLGYLAQPLTVNQRGENLDPLSGVSPQWLAYCQRWRTTSTLSKSSRKTYFWCLIKVGRWLAHQHPELDTPEQWTRELAAEYVAAVLNLSIGDWTHREESQDEQDGAPLSAKTKVQQLKAVSTFIRDCQEWNWIQRCFDPRRAFTTPRSNSVLARH